MFTETLTSIVFYFRNEPHVPTAGVPSYSPQLQRRRQLLNPHILNAVTFLFLHKKQRKRQTGHFNSFVLCSRQLLLLATEWIAIWEKQPSPQQAGNSAAETACFMRSCAHAEAHARQLRRLNGLESGVRHMFPHASKSSF